MEKKNNGKAIAALVLGIVSVVFCFFGVGAIVSVATGIVGLILAIQARKEGTGSNGMAVAGLVLSIIGLIGGAIIFISCVACVGCAASSIGSMDALSDLYY